MKKNSKSKLTDVKQKVNTIFIDIDGCLVKQQPCATELFCTKVYLLPGVKEKFDEWESQGNRIIITTARKESRRRQTEEQLSELGLFWDQLVMGITGGKRYLINDLKTDTNIATAIAINVKRNEGLKNVSLEDATIAQTKII